MENVNGVRVFNPANRKVWRKWLSEHHATTEPVCVVIYRKGSSTPNISYEESVEEALCYGWIDNKGLKRDSESMYLQFVPRKEKGNWSALNRERAERMMKQGLMTRAGKVFIDLAKKSGKWDAALTVDVVPPDLKKAFDKKKKAFQHFEAFSPSSRRLILQWIAEAKRPETRKTRIEKTVVMAGKNLKAK